ncbi:MAG: CopD family protein [Snowella sp.]|nr:CopD family protein [Snowella sp.]
MSNLTLLSLLLIHVLGATIWTGGHLILALRFLPEAWQKKDLSIIQQFEERFEILGLIALAGQVLSGLGLAWLFLPDLSSWLNYQSPMARGIEIKLGLLLLTVTLALDARLRLIPNLNSDKFNDLALHIIGITVLAVLFVVVGVGLQLGGI